MCGARRGDVLAALAFTPRSNNALKPTAALTSGRSSTLAAARPRLNAVRSAAYLGA